MQTPTKAVNSFVHALKGGFSRSYGSFFCETFNEWVFFGIWGKCPGFSQVNRLLTDYFGPTYGNPPDDPNDLKTNMLRELYRIGFGV